MTFVISVHIMTVNKNCHWLAYQNCIWIAYWLAYCIAYWIGYSICYLIAYWPGVDLLHRQLATPRSHSAALLQQPHPALGRCSWQL